MITVVAFCILRSYHSTHVLADYLTTKTSDGYILRGLVFQHNLFVIKSVFYAVSSIFLSKMIRDISFQTTKLPCISSEISPNTPRLLLLVDTHGSGRPFIVTLSERASNRPVLNILDPQNGESILAAPYSCPSTVPISILTKNRFASSEKENFITVSVTGTVCCYTVQPSYEAAASVLKRDHTKEQPVEIGTLKHTYCIQLVAQFSLKPNIKCIHFIM